MGSGLPARLSKKKKPITTSGIELEGEFVSLEESGQEMCWSLRTIKEDRGRVEVEKPEKRGPQKEGEQIGKKREWT